MASPAAGAVNLGSAYGEVLIDLSNVERQLNNAFSNAERSISGFMTRTGASLQRIGAGITVATLPIAGFVQQGISAFANFEEVLAEIEARTGATAEQMKLVQEKALEMGRDTKYSATQASEAMLQLLTSGYNLDQTFIALGPTLALATAGALDLGYAADSLTDILSQFQLEASEAGKVADILTQAAGASSAEVEDLVASFRRVGPNAKNFGLTVQETAAALAVMAENGVKGEEAGTQLGSMFDAMTRQVDGVQEMWRKLGISLYDAQGNMRDLDSIIDDLNRATAGMSDRDRINTVKTLAGSYGDTALLALMAAGGIDKMSESMEEQATASEVAQKRMGGWRGMIESLRGSLETLQIRVFQPLVTKYLTPIGKEITTIINKITDWLAKNEGVAMGIGLLMGALVLLGPTLIAVGTAVQFLGFAIAGVTTLMGVFSGVSLPFIAILLAIAAAVGVLILAYKTNFLGLKDFVNGFVADVGKIIGTVTGFISRIREVGLTQALDEFYQKGGRFQKTGRGVVRGILDIVGAIAGFVKLVRKNGFVAAFEQVFTTLGDGSSWIGNILQSFGLAQTRAEGIGRTINRLALTFMNGVQAIRTFVRGLVSAFNDGGFRGAFDYLKNAAAEALPIFLEGLQSLISGVWTWIREKTPELADGLGQMIGDGLRFLVDKIIEYGPPILIALGGILLAIGAWMIGTGLPEFFGFAFDLIDGFMTGIIDGFGDVNWGEVWNTVWGLAKQGAGLALAAIWQIATWARQEIILPIFDYLREVDWGEVWATVWNAAKKAAGVALALLWQISVWVREKIFEPIADYLREVDWGEVWTFIWNAMKKAAGLTLALLWQISVWVREKIFTPISNFLKGINWGEVWTAVWNAAKHAAGLALALLWNFSQWTREKVLMPIWNYIKSINWSQVATDLWNGFKNGVQSIWDSLNIGGFLKGLAEGGVREFKNALGIQSPSTVMWNIGADIVAGLRDGINQNGQGALMAAMNLANGIRTQVQGAQAAISALNALAARPVGANVGLGALGNRTSNFSNFNVGGVSVVVPPSAVSPNRTPTQNGRGIGAGLSQRLSEEFTKRGIPK
jgi:TP901 family phage tail tape measure protein